MNFEMAEIYLCTWIEIISIIFVLCMDQFIVKLNIYLSVKLCFQIHNKLEIEFSIRCY